VFGVVSLRWIVAVVVVAAVLSVAAAGAALSGHHRPSVAAQRALAQQRVLSVLGRNWNPRRIAAIVDPGTRLARDGTQVMCHGAGHSRAAAARGRFTCVVRPMVPGSTTRLWLSYRTLSATRFRVHWLAYTGA
jgi:hypothetical protein